jgi:hypothetical protein
VDTASGPARDAIGTSRAAKALTAIGSRHAIGISGPIGASRTIGMNRTIGRWRHERR